MKSEENKLINKLTAFGACPSKEQIEYQKEELSAFIHFGINTFMDREWGNGKENPGVFNPTNLNTDQWIRILKEAGFKRVILTAKHHDGFCLWDSRYTKHSISKSPWKNGKGDVVSEMSRSCKKYGVKFAIYLSPWDENSEYYGKGDLYNQYYENQLKELLGNYGDIAEVWMDGAKGSDVKQDYNFDEWFRLIKSMHKECIIFSPHGPDIRWIGNEKGYAGEPCWSTVNLDKMKVTVNQKYLNTGEEGAKDWVIGECDVSIRPGWFYHEEQNQELKSLDKLLDIYFNSVGRNSVLLLNVPPTKEGLIHKNDERRLKEFGQAINDIFKDNLALNKRISVSSKFDNTISAENLIDENYNTYWAPDERDSNPYLQVDFDENLQFDLICIQEYIKAGQRVAEFNIEAFIDDKWKKVFSGKTIGYKRLIRIEPIYATRVRINFTRLLEIPMINNIAVYKQPKEFEKNADIKASQDMNRRENLGFEKNYYNVNENIGEISLKVVRKGDISRKIEVDYNTISGTAVNGENYQPWSGTLTFNEGECEKEIKITIINTDILKETRYFNVRLEDTLGIGILDENVEIVINIEPNK